MKSQLSRFVLSGFLATGLTLGSAAAFAQQESTTPAPGASTQQPADSQGRGGHKHMDPDQAVAHMAKRYSLTTDQQAQIKPILVNQQEQMQALRQDTSMTREDKIAKVKSIRDDSSTKIQALLNDNQKQKFTADQQRRQERMQERNAAPAATPTA